jgi:hypothetical protein
MEELSELEKLYVNNIYAMEYIKILWKHLEKNYPRQIYVQLNDQRYEVRKVEIYEDDRIAYADGNAENGAFLSPEPYTSLDEFNSSNGIDEVFATVISAEEFEQAWRRVETV